MFSSEYNGYNKKEVDEYLSNLKADHERMLMEERLKVLDAEKKVLDIKKKNIDVENRERNILAVLESFKKLQAEGSRNIDVLRVEQLKTIYFQLQDFLLELNEKYPGLLVNNSYKKLVTDIENVIQNTQTNQGQLVKANSGNDSMRILLSKMKEKKNQDNVKEVRVERVKSVDTNQIRPVCDLQLNENDKYDNLVDKFLDTKPTEKETPKIEIQSNGFDLKEAINPKDDLSEIMKAFDFYSSDGNKPSDDDYNF